MAFLLEVAGTAAAAVAGLLMDCNREYGALLGGVFTLPLAVLFAGVGLLLLALLAWIGVIHASTCLLYTVGSIHSFPHLLLHCCAHLEFIEFTSSVSDNSKALVSHAKTILWHVLLPFSFGRSQLIRLA